jgi:hypothetical protein
MDGLIKSVNGFCKLGEEMCTLSVPKFTHPSPFFYS